jgi:hypothetical protein
MVPYLIMFNICVSLFQNVVKHNKVIDRIKFLAVGLWPSMCDICARDLSLAHGTLPILFNMCAMCFKYLNVCHIFWPDTALASGIGLGGRDTILAHDTLSCYTFVSSFFCQNFLMHDRMIGRTRFSNCLSLKMKCNFDHSKALISKPLMPGRVMGRTLFRNTGMHASVGQTDGQ